ncbi:MAG: FAD-dependent oxidoreductase [Chitinophagaceae bacterium]
MIENIYDIIVIGAGSGGLSVGLTMNKLGFKVLMIHLLANYVMFEKMICNYNYC